MDDSVAAGAGPPAPPDEVRTTANEDSTSTTPTGRPRRAADGSGLFQLLASVPGANAPTALGVAPNAPNARNVVSGPGAWTRRPRLGRSLPTRKIKLPDTQETQDLFNNTVCITLVGRGWTQVRNEEIIKALQEKDIDVRRIEGAWKDSRLRHLQVTFNSQDEAMKTVALRTFQLGEVTATIRGRNRHTEIKIHFVPAWMSTDTVASIFRDYGEVIRAEHIFEDHHEARYKTGTVSVTLRADHNQAAAIPPRIEVEQHGVMTPLMVNVRGQPFLCWTCGEQNHPSSRCPDKFIQLNNNDNDEEEDNEKDEEEDNDEPPEPTEQAQPHDTTLRNEAADTTPMETDETSTEPTTPTNEGDETKRKEILEFFRQTNVGTPEIEKEIREADPQHLELLHSQMREHDLTTDNTTPQNDETEKPKTPTNAILEAAVAEMTDTTPDSLTKPNDETGTDTETGGVAAAIAKTFRDGVAKLKRRHSKTPEIESHERTPSETEAYEETQKLLEKEKQTKKKQRQEEKEALKKEKEDIEKERQRQRQAKEQEERKKQQAKERKEQEEKTRRDRDAAKRKEITDYYRQTDRWTPDTAKRVTTADSRMLDAIYAGLRDMKSADRLEMTPRYDPDTFLRPQTSLTERQRHADRQNSKPTEPRQTNRQSNRDPTLQRPPRTETSQRSSPSGSFERQIQSKSPSWEEQVQAKKPTEWG